MEKEVILNKIISVQPIYLNSDLVKTVFKLSKLKYEKTCNEEDGIILSIKSLKNMTNMISKDARDIYFNLSLVVNVVKPEKYDKIKFIPTLIIEKGIFGKIYDMISLFIPSDNIQDWTFDKEGAYFYKGDEKIEKNVELNAIIDEIKFNGTRYNCLCKIG